MALLVNQVEEIKNWLNTPDGQLIEPNWLKEHSMEYALKHLYIAYRNARRGVERCKEEAKDLNRRAEETESNSNYNSQVMTDSYNAICKLLGVE